MKSQIKNLSELNLIDSFLFSSSTENIQDAEFIARLIIKRATGYTLDKIIIQPEKQFKGLNINKKGIRLDLYVTEERDNGITRIYDIEPNTYVRKNLPQRSRFYQSKVDSKNLNTGEDFNKLPDFISIWILSYDPFKENRMIYHVKNVVEENPEICYNDGTARIYLYTSGELGGTEELKAFLKFFQDSRESNATDDELKKLLEIVNRIKSDEKVGEEYMVFKEDIDYEREDARAQGIISSFRKFNATDEQIIAELMEECNLTEDEARERLACNQ